MPIMTSSHAYWTQISTLAQHLSAGDEVITLGYLAGASKALFLASLSHQLRRPLLVVTPTATEAELLAHDLRFFTASAEPSTRIILLPAEEHAPYEPASETSDLTSQRLIALRSMLQGDMQIIVTTPRAMAPYVMPRVLLRQTGLELAPGMTLDRQECLERLLRCGYHQVDLVEEWGDFGVRGGIIDLFPPHLPRPIRLEFMGDEIESLREFDPATQRSLRAVGQVTVVPSTRVHQTSSHPGMRLRPGPQRQTSISQDSRRCCVVLKQYIFPPGVERLLPVFSDALEPLFNYLPPDAVLSTRRAGYYRYQTGGI